MMFELGRHGGYILASYAAALIIMGGLIAMSVTGYRRAKARLAAAGDESGE
jgi:heme exporter protein CcmD